MEKPPADLPEGCEWDSELCFPDGSLIIHDEDLTFRVYRHTLEQLSPVFQAKIASIAADDVYNGCPVLCLDDDQGDMATFLRAVFVIE